MQIMAHSAHTFLTPRNRTGETARGFRKKIDDGGFETPYRLRKPVFRQIKQARGFHQFLLRGKVRAEWAMICTAPQSPELRKGGLRRLARNKPRCLIRTGSSLAVCVVMVGAQD